MSFHVKDFHKLGKKIVGAGLNYNSLIKIRNAPVPTEPIFFLKPTTSYIVEGEDIVIPEGYDVHHEVELGVIVGKRCKNVKVEEANNYIGGYCLALDLTAVDQVAFARSNGLPWTKGKSFDTATPVSSPLEREHLVKVGGHDTVNLWCSVNGQMRQNDSTRDMVFNVSQLVAIASSQMTLEPYDVILTGSPSGVGPIRSGDVITAGLADMITMSFNVK